MAYEPVVSLELAQVLREAGAPLYAGSYWVSKDGQHWTLWHGPRPDPMRDGYADISAAFTLGEIMEELDDDISALCRWHHLDGEPWGASGVLIGKVGYGETPLDALSRFWLMVLQRLG